MSLEIGGLASTQIVSVDMHDSLAEAAKRMTSRSVGCAIVHTEDGPPGIITERDLLRSLADGVDPEHTTVDNYMTANAITASSTWDVVEAARTMFEGGFRHLIVLGEDGSPGGVLSIRDLVKPLLEAADRTTLSS